MANFNASVTTNTTYPDKNNVRTQISARTTGAQYINICGSASAQFSDLTQLPAPAKVYGMARSVSWAEFQWAKLKEWWEYDADARYFQLLAEIASLALVELMVARMAANAAVYTVIGEGGAKVGTVTGRTKLFRYDPRNVATPMKPHNSPVFFDEVKALDYGLGFNQFEALFTVTGNALKELKALRKSQGYFNGDVVLRSSTVRELMATYPEAKILTDYIFNWSVLGSESGGIIVAVRAASKVK